MAANRTWRLAAALVGLALPGLAQTAPEQVPERSQLNYYMAPVPGSAAQDGPSAQPQPHPGQEETMPPIEQRRRLSRSFRVAKPGQAFALDTRYGHVRISAWNKPEMKVEAELIARAETDAGASQLLDGLGVQWLDYDARTGGVAVNSQFGPALKGRCSGGGCRYEVNYTIWLPSTTALRLTSSFADVTVASDWQGPAQLTVNYGALRTGRLSGTANVVHIANGDATLPYARQASLQADYARLRLDAGEQIELQTNYSDIDMGTVHDLTVHSKYGDVALGTVRTLRGSSGYSHFSVGKLSEGLDMAVRYCPDFEVRDMGANFRQITLDGGYSTIRLGFAEATPSFRFDVSTEQGQLLVDKKQVRVLSEGGKADGIADVMGVYGGRVPARGAGNVNIKVRYGTVRFSK
ncbi:hypothetical protein GCM10023172_19910 [Hymenobacter ginsengisoli]|uniref:Adhesin domain-containing protein n=1 Tax=Hymenobacter ginsengisoli TaxID=1051626 RepID=A0ABP8QC14_9BACT|nr:MULTISPECIES: hypothetical protein [unclassified Hymenobacter]MBO2031450.1 hypothetical protein [Hymenobacter sp. BT559]